MKNRSWVLTRYWMTPLQKVLLASLLAAAGFTAAGCAPVAWMQGGSGGLAESGQGVSQAKPGIDIEALEQRVHQLVNHERAQKGLHPLAWNPVLNNIARQHSRDMAKRHYFAHLSPEGHDLAYRFARQGFVCLVKADTATYTGSENIYETSHYEAIDYVNDIPTRTYWKDPETIAQTVVKGWMSSPTHRANLLDPFWQTQGIGIAVSTDDRIYITEDFC